MRTEWSMRTAKGHSFVRCRDFCFLQGYLSRCLTFFLLLLVNKSQPPRFMVASAVILCFEPETGTEYQVYAFATHRTHSKGRSKIGLIGCALAPSPGNSDSSSCGLSRFPMNSWPSFCRNLWSPVDSRDTASSLPQRPSPASVSVLFASNCKVTFQPSHEFYDASGNYYHFTTFEIPTETEARLIATCKATPLLYAQAIPHCVESLCYLQSAVADLLWALYAENCEELWHLEQVYIMSKLLHRQMSRDPSSERCFASRSPENMPTGLEQKAQCCLYLPFGYASEVIHYRKKCQSGWDSQLFGVPAWVNVNR